MAAVATDWKDKLRELREADETLSERALAEAVGKAPSTVHDALVEMGLNDGASSEPIPGQVDLDGNEVSASSNGHGSLDAFKEEAGEAVGDMPPRPPERDDAPPVEEIRVDGTAQLGMFDAGGKKPQSASLRLSGGRILLVDGRAFRKGDVIRGSFTAVVREVAQRDKPDPQTGIVVSAEQKHVAQITDLTVNG